jgi:NAD(P)H-hydrate epimerase
MRIFSAEAMARLDRAAVEELGVPSLVLMENAALGLAEAVARSFPAAGTVAIFCGPGNNGGDGLALARHLAIRGYDVTCFLAFGGREPRGDAATQLAICRRLAPELLRLTELPAGEDPAAALSAAREADLVVDALFGTGLARPLAGWFAGLVEGLDALPVPKLAVDLPSGLAGSRSDLFGPHLRADVTVTFGAPKPAQIFPPAADAVGELVVADLGIPLSVLDRGGAGEGEDELHLLLAEEAAALLPPPRAAGAHKGDFGHLLVVAGATGKAGAAILAARAAVRSGAGLVTAAVPEPIVQTVDGGSIESMSLALPAGAGGRLAAGAADAILAAARGKDALALGPGLGQGDPEAGEIRRAVLECDLPLALDADGVNAFAGRAAELAVRRAPTVLTPHPGELGRLLGTATAEVSADRPGAARRAARETGAVVVLKGHLTLVATPEGAVWVAATGNPGLATGGTGDVLTGMVGAFLAQGYEPLEAALLGVHLHGLAGDLAAAARGEIALAAGDLIEHLPAAFRTLAEG